MMWEEIVFRVECYFYPVDWTTICENCSYSQPRRGPGNFARAHLLLLTLLSFFTDNLLNGGLESDSRERTPTGVWPCERTGRNKVVDIRQSLDLQETLERESQEHNKKRPIFNKRFLRMFAFMTCCLKKHMSQVSWKVMIQRIYMPTRNLMSINYWYWD